MNWTTLALTGALALSAGASSPAPEAALPAAETVVGKLTGPVVSITPAEDWKSAVAVLKDSKTDEEVEILVDDQLTLEKFKDKRISVGDDIRCKYELKDGKKRSTYFRKVGGC
ncbi:MAG: hypothetical protein Q8T11_09575 [Elusimicrobiota bacterium]|nr:hypothetical protein [Elusimicrobiota bacterium]